MGEPVWSQNLRSHDASFLFHDTGCVDRPSTCCGSPGRWMHGHHGHVAGGSQRADHKTGATASGGRHSLDEVDAPRWLVASVSACGGAAAASSEHGKRYYRSVRPDTGRPACRASGPAFRDALEDPCSTRRFCSPKRNCFAQPHATPAICFRVAGQDPRAITEALTRSDDRTHGSPSGPCLACPSGWPAGSAPSSCPTARTTS
jgi:hypothetical protein